MNIRSYRPDDAPVLLDFARSLPEEDRNFLKEDATNPKVVEEWADQGGINRSVAWDDDEVVGYVAIHPLGGWSRHVAELRVVVAPAARDLGIGQSLVRQGLLTAIEGGVDKVVVEVVADHDRTIGMLQANGFTPEALLVDHVRDRAGALRDLMMLTCRTAELVDDLSLMGVDEAMGEVG